MLKPPHLFIFSIAMALILFGIKFLVVDGKTQTEPVGHHATSSTSNCVLSQKPCSLEGLGQLSTPSDLVVEQPFEVYFSPAQQSDVAPELAFNMKAMNMGHNHYTMVKKDGLWKAIVTLPRCASGHTQWIMTVKDNQKTADMILDFPK
ncbi:MAG: hypothetical protein K2P98_06785 [Neisseriaceae bacterium]|nr:hypothetical protein [Neisseriaceae bacterium]